MTLHDDGLYDQIAALALGVLNASEAQPLRLHISTCEQCRTQYGELRVISNAVGYSAEVPAAQMSEQQSARMKARIFSALSSRLDAKFPVAAPPQQPQRSTWLAYTLAAASMLLALFSGLRGITLDSELHTSEERITQLSERINDQARAAAEQNARIADIFASDGLHYTVAGGEVIKRSEHLYLAMNSLPKLPPGHVFQAWTLGRKMTSVVPSITFLPNRQGIAIVQLPTNAANVIAIAVSIEPEGGSKKPTSTPLFLRLI